MSVFRKNWFFLYFCLLAFSLNTRAESPRIGSAYTQLRSEPLFTSPILKLAKTWGPTIPVNTEFQVEKAYGRWLYGQPKPLTKMRAKDYAPKGWIFSRQLIAPGDENSLDEKSTKKIFSAIQHTEIHKQALQLQSNTEIAKVNFLDSIVLSKKTLELFIKTDEQISTEKSKTLFHELSLKSPAILRKKESLGLSGPSLEFLDFEINEIEKKKQAILAKEKAKKLTPPILMSVDQNIHTKILSRSVLAEQYVHPPLTQEEVDGHSYMNVVSHPHFRAARKNIQAYWKSNLFMFFSI
ncbi:MAG: hypothetical protein M9962_11650 [Oligoflexia bacterium]|nr:hypothetical protein [Oligoflexia bacterium]